MTREYREVKIAGAAAPKVLLSKECHVILNTQILGHTSHSLIFSRETRCDPKTVVKQSVPKTISLTTNHGHRPWSLRAESTWQYH